MFTRLRKLARNARGATSIEYAILSTAIALAIVVVVGGIGSKLGGFFLQASAGLK